MSEKNLEQHWDTLLKIRTGGRDDSHAGVLNYPYEPTPYSVLERLSLTGYITKHNTLVDFGSGKGRVSIFLSWQTRCKSIGVEYDRTVFERAEVNLKKSAVSFQRVCFVLTGAEGYDIPDEADRFYFFNPFSVEILKRVLKRMITLQYSKPAERLLIFYYPSQEYISCLEDIPELTLKETISCRDLFTSDEPRERIEVWSMNDHTLYGHSQ